MIIISKGLILASCAHCFLYDFTRFMNATNSSFIYVVDLREASNEYFSFSDRKISEKAPICTLLKPVTRLYLGCLSVNVIQRDS